MQLLDQFITQTVKQPADWTSQDIQKYLAYVKAQVMELSAEKNDNASNGEQINDYYEWRYE
jgi:hypothetical protein